MTTIFPLPTTGRTSNILLYQRLLTQTQGHQEGLLRIQDQVSTGRRISRPSEDPLSAARAIQLQRLLEQNGQYQSNISVGDSYLKETETAIATSLDLLRDVRGLAITGVDTSTDDSARIAIVQELRQALDRFVTLGNSQSQDRYLFSGSDVNRQAYSYYNDAVVFNGNNDRLRSYVDINALLSTNISGVEVFGGESIEVESTVDLNPTLSLSTRLSSLNGGRGVSLGRIDISDGSNTTRVDLRGAETVGDIVRILEKNPPFGRQVAVDVSPTGLELNLDNDSPGYLRIREVDGGHSANDLGILTPAGANSKQVIGSDLNPALTPVTRFDELLGVRASVVLDSPGSHNDILVRAKEVGTQLNDYHFQYVDDDQLQALPGISQGNEQVNFSATPVAARGALSFSGAGNNLVLTANSAGAAFNQVAFAVVDAGPIGNAATVSFDSANGVLQIGVDSGGATDVQAVINAVNTEGTFTASYDSSDVLDGGFNPSATISASDIGTVHGNTGNSGGDANTVFIHVDRDKSTANDVIQAIEANPFVSDKFSASLLETDSVNGINNGTGRVSATSTGTTADGSGTPLDVDSGIQVRLGTETHVFRLSDAETVQDFLNQVNSSGLPIHARINERSNSIDLVSRASGIDFSVGENGGTTATQLGLRSFTRDTRLDTLNYGRGVDTGDGPDLIIRRNDGVELEFDLSNANTVGDVLDIINAHPNNQDPATQVTARLAVTGNGIEIVDDNPPGTATVAVLKTTHSHAAIDLGLVPTGATEGYPSQSAAPTPATLDVSFAYPDNLNTSFTLTANTPGTDFNGVQVQIISSAASGNEALVNYDSNTKILTIDVDPNATTADKLIESVSLEGTFNAELNKADDVGNTGNGLIPVAGPVGITAGGSSQPTAIPATASLSFPSPNDVNSAIRLEAALAGTQFNDVEIVFSDTLAGDNATASYDAGNRRLTVNLDASATTANTIVNAITAEGTFNASLDTSVDASNDGSGVVAATGTIATTSGGTPEVLIGKDVNPLESHSIFNSITRLIDAFSGDLDVEDAQRASALIEEDLQRLLDGQSDVAVRQRALASFQFQLEEQSVQLKESISTEIDVDLVAAVSGLTQQQQAFQASLQMTGRILQTTLLDYL